MEHRKPILCLDFDGVIHDYREGWRGGEIYGNATPGFWNWATEAKRLFDLAIYSSRSATKDGRLSMWCWLKHQWGIWAADQSNEFLATEAASYMDFKFVSEKPPAFLTIDDRAVQFGGSWDDFDPKLLRAFTPWMASAGEPQRLSYRAMSAEGMAYKQLVLDLHAALGVEWGDDIYAEIARLKKIDEELKGLE